MKTGKSPENGDVTPSKKKLKQARLPFKLISEVSSTSTATSSQTRKRKLSTPESETVSKIGKTTNENNVVKELIVISDDDSRGEQKIEKQEKQVNPFVKLVDNAWKKKLHRKSSKKKQNNKKHKEMSNTSEESVNDNITENEYEKTAIEMMDVDESSQSNGNNNKDTANQFNEQEIIQDSKTKTKEVSLIVEPKNKNVVINIEDSLGTKVIESNNKTVEAALHQCEVSEIKCVNDKVDNKENKQSPKTVQGDFETPPKTKRTTRNKAKITDDTDLNSLSSSSKLNESICSNTSLRNNRASPVTDDVVNESLNESFSRSNNLTPKQLQKKMESVKRREEKEKEKQEREKKKQQEKEEKAKQKQEKEEQKKREREEKEEAKRKEREEKEEQRKKEKEEKERQKELEKKLKEEKEEQKRKEREDKEEQRKKEKEAKEEEKRKKQEALEQEKQEQELKKKKAAEAFVNFFVPKQKVEKDQTTVEAVSKNSVLSSFTIKADMRLAPTVRVNLNKEQVQTLEKLLTEQNESQNMYLRNLKEGKIKPKSSGKTWPLSDKDDDVMIIEDELPPIDGAGEIVTCDSVPREKLRPKLLSFHENMRPPYWGTWRKKSPFVKPRRPFGQDKQKLDYEVDSDEEWEEEQEGESIDGSVAGSDDEQGPDEYEVDNEVFVPHGYLSDEEATMDEDDVLSLSPETQKARLKYLEDEFESEMKKPTEKLKPRLYGLLWETSDGGKPEKCVDALWNYFGKLSMVLNDPTSLLESSNEPEEMEKKKLKKKKTMVEGEQQSPKSEKKKKKPDNKESKKNKTEVKKNTSEVNKNQPGINTFLNKLKST